MRGARRRRMHVDDVGADGDVHRHRDAEPRRGGEHARPRVLRLASPTGTGRPPARGRARRATPSVMAAFSSRPVSSAMPKRPGPSASSTSSEVAPTSATSKSWMTAAPLVAMADTKPRSIRSTRIGPSPVLITCAPSPQTTPPPSRAASAIARTTALKSAAARMPGQRFDERADRRRRRSTGRAKSSTRALLCARLQRIGRDAGEVEFFVGERHGPRFNARMHECTNAQMHEGTNVHAGRSVAPCISCIRAFLHFCIVKARASRRRSCRTGTPPRSPGGRPSRTRSRPAKADTSISSDDRGRWKFVTSPETIRNSKPGKMKSSVSPLARRDPPGRPPRRLERPRRRRADGDDPAPLVERAVDRAGRRGGNLEPLGLDAMLLDALDAHRLERAVADVQRDLGHLDALRARGRRRVARLKCRPAVGAATDPRARAKTVW